MDASSRAARFDRARDLYRESSLPIIRRQHNTDNPTACQRLREDHDRRLGCSGCPQKMCRNDNRLAKTLLMAALVPEAKPFKGLTVKRLAHLNHGTIASPIPGNVREMDDTTLTCPREFEWQVIADYPFDERGYGSDEDLRTVERFRDSRPADAPRNPTVVWLPTFFSHSLERELGDLVVLEHILDGEPRKYLGHLRVEDQSTTRADLASLRAQKEALVKRTLAQAYGLAMANDSSFLDQSRTVDEHFIPLLGELDIRAVLAGTMKDGFRQVVDTVLSKKYPHHPRFDGTISATRMEKIGALVEKLLDERDRRMNVEKGERNDLRAYADPLGITETGDVAVLLNERPFCEREPTMFAVVRCADYATYGRRSSCDTRARLTPTRLASSARPTTSPAASIRRHSRVRALGSAGRVRPAAPASADRNPPETLQTGFFT